MAYFLRFDGSNDKVTVSSGIPMSDGISIDIDFEYGGDNGDILSGFISGNPGRWALLVTSGSNLSFFSGTSGTTVGTIPLVTGTRYTVNLTYSGGVVTVSLDGTQDFTVSPSTLLPLTQINNGILTMDLYGMTVTNGALIHNYDPSASGGTGSILPDTVGSNDGTLVNFPNDDSQWVFYDDGQGGIVTADAAYTISAPAFTANASATLPQPTADGAFSIASPLFSASATATLPQPIADAAFTINAPTFAATASATIPGFNASVSFAIPAPTFSADAAVTLPSPTADVSYTIAAPTFSVDADATLPQPSSDVAFTVNSPSFAVTATATEPGFNASVNFTVNAPTFAVDATATLPQPSADVGFTVSAPTFSVVAIVGGIAIIVDNETNINVPALATNINAPVLSNNMRI